MLNMQNIIGQFSNMAVFGRFLSGQRLCCCILAHILCYKSKQDHSSCCFPFNLLCQWFFEWFFKNIEVIGQYRWEWKLCLGPPLRSLNKSLVTCTHNLGASGDWALIRQQPWLRLIIKSIVIWIFASFCTLIITRQDYERIMPYNWPIRVCVM